MSKYVGFRLGKVHESHVISEYYCGGCGWPVTDHDSFCPECGGAFRECDASSLEAENAKLRELVSQLIYCAERVGNEDIFYYQPTRDGCGFDCVANGEHCSFVKMCDRARELGVEVASV